MRVGVGGGGFILKGVAEALGDVVVISVSDRCSAVLRSAAVAPAYRRAPVAVRVGVGGGGFILRGVAEALRNVVMISSIADRCSAVLRLAGVRVVAVLAAPPTKGGGL